jgi:hypothetical protein
MSAYCPCGAELKSLAAQAHGVCDYCRKDAKKPVRRREAEPAATMPLFEEPEPQDRRLVPLDGWPDYHAQGVRT